jgi:hypothetical protein
MSLGNLGDPNYWEQVTGSSTPPPEVPQVPDVAYTVICLNCRHTLDRHELEELEYTTVPATGMLGLRQRWCCHTTLQRGLVISPCPCSVFRPSPEHTRNFREEPPI